MNTTTTEAAVTPDASMSAVLEAYPGARRALFRAYHIGGCSSCGFQPGETLAEVCRRNGGLDVHEVLARIQESHQEDQKILIAPGELNDLLSGSSEVRLLDIRTREEFEAARVSGAVLFTQEVMNEMLGRWPRELLLVIYDHTGDKSMDAAAYFLGHGFRNVRALRGGIDAWSREVDPSIRRYRLE